MYCIQHVVNCVSINTNPVLVMQNRFQNDKAVSRIEHYNNITLGLEISSAVWSK